MFDLQTLVLIVLTYLLAGTVKGIIGMGLPIISVGILTTIIGLQPAVALIIIPGLVTNLWQSISGGHGRAVLARIWPFLGSAILAVGLGGLAMTRVEIHWLTALLGGLLVLYSGFNLLGLRLVIPPQWEYWAGPLAGVLNGIFTGMTGAGVFPGVPYLQAIGLPRDMLVQAMGMLFASTTLALGVSLHSQALLTTELVLTSVGALVPAFLGMMIGRRLRHFIPEQGFRRIFFVWLLLVGGVIAVKSLMMA